MASANVRVTSVFPPVARRRLLLPARERLRAGLKEASTKPIVFPVYSANHAPSLPRAKVRELVIWPTLAGLRLWMLYSVRLWVAKSIKAILSA